MTRPPLESESGVTTRVLTSLIDLVHAELKLCGLVSRSWANQIALALVLTLVATTLTQTTLVAIGLSPVLFAWRSWPAAVGVVSPLLLASVVGWVVAIRAWRSVSSPRSAEQPSAVVENAHDVLPAPRNEREAS